GSASPDTYTLSLHVALPISSSSLDRYLAVQAERFRNPVLRIFHTELEAVYEEKNRTLDNDGRKVFETLFATLFKNHNYGKQTTIDRKSTRLNSSHVKISYAV